MVKGLKDENAPKRPLSAYFAWCATVRAKVTKSLPEGSGVAQAGKKMSEMWNKLTDSQKAPFEKKYRSEKEKYDKKLAKYKLTKDYANFQKKKEQHKVDTVKNKKFKKDENAPKRPLSAFFLFMGDEREALIEGGLSFKVVMDEISRLKALDPSHLGKQHLLWHILLGQCLLQGLDCFLLVLTFSSFSSNLVLCLLYQSWHHATLLCLLHGFMCFL